MKFPALIAAIIIVASASAQDSYTLKHTPKKGEAQQYKLTSSSTTDLGSAEIAGTVSGTVVSVADDGSYVVEQKIDLKISFTGGEMPIAASTKTTYDANDNPTEMSGEGIDDGTKQSEFKNAALRSFHSPTSAVKIGDTWTFTQAASSKNGDTGAKVDYKVVAAEVVNGHKTLKVHVKGAQSGASDGAIESDAWIDQSTGIMIKTVGEMKHVELSPGMIGDTKFTMVLVE